MQVPTEFFTLTTLLTFTGAMVASWLIPYVFFLLIGENFRPYMKWTAFAVGIGLMVLAAYLNSEQGWVKYIVAMVNGFVIFLASVGSNEIMANRSLRIYEKTGPATTARNEAALSGASETIVSTGDDTYLVGTEGAFKTWL